MNTVEAIRTRRAVKVYDPSFQLSREEKDELLQLALLAPSAFNLQHVRFVRGAQPIQRVEEGADGHSVEVLPSPSKLACRSRREGRRVGRQIGRHVLATEQRSPVGVPNLCVLD